MENVEINLSWKESVVLEMTLLQCKGVLEQGNVHYDRDFVMENINKCLQYLEEKLEKVK